MDINALNTYQINQANVPFSSKQSQLASNDGQTKPFEELLKKAQSQPASKNSDIKKDDKLFEACMELETFLIKNMLKSMRATIQKSNFLETGFAGEIYEDMLYDEHAKTYAKNAGFGFAEMAYRDLSRNGF